ncbi:MAG: hypothetical protein ACF8NJ_04300 [Phycisphaerales bacterium JB038]
MQVPFLTSYDPAGSSEGTIDPLGLYQIADMLATRLVPAGRERMLRIRFLTAIAVGALVTEGLESNPDEPETPPFLVWAGLVVEAIIRSMDGLDELWGVPGSLVTLPGLESAWVSESAKPPQIAADLRLPRGLQASCGPPRARERASRPQEGV